MIKIIDYGMGNCGSIKSMLRYLGADADIVDRPSSLIDASAIILPGVGSYDQGVKGLDFFKETLTELVLHDEVPFIGICLGMQLLLEESEEGLLGGLGWIPGKVKRFNFSGQSISERLVVPHMGWNEVCSARPNRLIHNIAIEEKERFYFVHSFHATNVPEENVILKSHYGYDFVCGIQKKNIYGVQFHPEKSHKFGKSLLKNFVGLQI